MKKLYPTGILLLSILVISSINAQVQTAGNWNANNTQLGTVYTDDDNGDGVGDGAIYVGSLTTNLDQGATFTFDGSMTLNESISISTYNYNTRNSYVRFNVQLYNLTDSSVLATTSPYISIVGVPQNPVPINTILNYTALASDVGDVLQVRYVRVTPFDTFREFAIDNLSLNGTYVSIDLSQSCPFTLTPDLPLLASNPTIEADINLAVSRFSDRYLGTSAPSAGNLASAESAYAALNISETGGVISGNPISSFSNASFLRTFAQHLKFNPSDSNIQEKANNTVWWVSKQFCTGDLARDLQKYSYEDFARPASLLKDFLEPAVKDLFAYTLYVHSGDYEHYWEATYDDAYQTANGSIDTDLVYNILDAMMAYVTWQETDQERYRYMRGFKRYLERFFTYTSGTSDGIKPDGSGFHHWTAYNNYMYAYKSAADLLSDLSETSFQVSPENYQVFRNAVYHQYISANDDYVQALSTAGRKPEARTNTFNQNSLKILAIEGGNILGLSTADPILAGLYNRLHGVEPLFNYNDIANFESGFFQLNHASASVFRKNNWVAFNKGFSDNMWGSEIYPSNNRYGRYQSYGALEVIYPGDKVNGNGYEVNTWDWNYNPGTTVIRLPWANLHAERGRIDETQQNSLVGAVNLKRRNSELLSKNHGQYGLFAMDFQELEGQGFNVTHSGENHNDTFTFKKSTFYFDDIIVALGSGITNDDTSNNTITTLYQRLDNSGNPVNVNGTNESSIGEVTFSGASNNWLLSNYDTGFYLLSGSYSLKVKKEVQQNPNYNQIWPVDYSGNATDTYYTGYIDHGTNPSNENYEYILKPNSSVSEMQDLHTTIQGGNKPYTVHQQNANAHIVEHETKNIWGYAFFSSAANLTYDVVTDVDSSCLVMTESDPSNQTLLVSLSNPDIGFATRSYAPSITVVKQLTLQGEWHFVTTDPNVVISFSNITRTVLDFTTVDGLAYEVLMRQGPETCGSSTTFESGSWSNGTPNTTKKAVFTEDYSTATNNIDACSCEIKNGAIVTVAAGDYMKIEGDIAVNGILKVEHTGSVVQVDDGALVINNGSIAVNLTTPSLNARDFMIMGSPMTAEDDAMYSAYQVLNHTTANFTPYVGVPPVVGVNFHDQEFDDWSNHTGVLTPGEGYLVRPSYTSGGTYNYVYDQGTLNNGVVTYPAEFGDNKEDSPNVLSNPYASAIDADLFIGANPIVDEVYFWEHLTTPAAGIPGPLGENFSMEDISMYNLSGGTPAANGGGTPNDVISTGQGFGIKANSAGDVTFNNSMRLTSGNTTLRRPVNKDLIWLTVRDSQYHMGSTTLIGFMETATSELDEGYDSMKLGTVVSLYSHLEDGSELLGIQGRESFDVSTQIPMGFSTMIDPDSAIPYTISISDIEGSNIEQATVYLVDHLENTITNLSESDYTFLSDAATYDNRFTLQFEPEVILGTQENDLEQISIHPNPTHDVLTIVSTRLEVTSVIVYDVRGRVVAENLFTTQGNYQIDLSKLETAMYFVEITTENGTLTKRVLKQ